MARSKRHSGIVQRFDDASGLGIVTDEQTGTEFDFHCTSIADGSRTIAGSTKVDFGVAAGQLGRLEANEITPINTSG